MNRFRSIFSSSLRPTKIIGMIHVKALPGTPLNQLTLGQIAEKACREAEMYRNCGIDGIIVENMHDLPYVKDIGCEIVSGMTKICGEVRRNVCDGIPLGVQILAGGNKEALSVASAAEFQFIRVEGFVFGHVADEGWIESCAGDLLRLRKRISAENVAVFADIKKKHSAHSVTKDVDIVETARAAQFFMADGVIVTGAETGAEADLREVDEVKLGCENMPVIVGSGVTKDNVRNFLGRADALIIGSHFKQDGKWNNNLDEDRIKHLLRVVDNRA